MWFLVSILIDLMLLLNNGFCSQFSPVSRSSQSTLLKDVSYYYQNGKIPVILKERKDRKKPNFASGNAKKSHDHPAGLLSTFSQSKLASDIKVFRREILSHQIHETLKTIEQRCKLQQKTKVARRKSKSIDVNQKLLKALKAKQLSPRPTRLVSWLEKARLLSKRSVGAIKMLRWSRKGELWDHRSQKWMKINPFEITVGGEGPKKFQKRSANYMEVPGPAAPQSAILQNQLSPRYLKSKRFLKNREANKKLMYSSNPQSNKCVLVPSNASLSNFRHLVYHLNLNYVQFHLIPDTSVSFSAQVQVIEHLKWVWTYKSKDGGREFLRWPVEFGVWSLGLLTVFTKSNMEIELIRVQGNCSDIKVGDRADDLVISKALNKLSQNLKTFGIEFESKYELSYFCYKRRTFVEPEALCVLCKNIVCPLDLLKYNCCVNTFNAKTQQRSVDCRASYRYDTLWWTIPSMVAVLVFASCPLLIMYISSKCSEIFVCKVTHTGTSQIINDAEPEIIYLDEKYPYTLIGTLLSPLGALIKQIPHWTRIVRFFIPFCSLFIILVQILLDYLFLYDFVVNSIDKGAVLGFRSLIAGFRKSSENFMPFFGGPYISLTIYLCLTCSSITIPKCLSRFLESGLQKYKFQEDTWTPLALDLQSIEYFGSVSISKTHGFQKIYTVYLGNFFMLLNFKFWKYVGSIFAKRWQSTNVCQFCWLMFPVYGIICILEIVICIVLNLLPIVSFGFTIGRAYCSAVSNCLSGRPPRIIMHLVQQILNLVIIICVLYFLFIFCTICFDASLFVTRVCMFTYTGIIVYPKESYGYLIFVLTVVYYIIVCSQTFAMKYRKLLKTSISVCKRVQRSNDQPQLIVNNGEYAGIHKPLFQHIVELHCPRRKEAFIAFYKFLMIVAILGISLDLLRKTDRFKQLDTLVHVGTALFTCALPTIFMNACRAPDEKYKERALKKEIMKTVKIYAGYVHANRYDTELLSD